MVEGGIRRWSASVRLRVVHSSWRHQQWLTWTVACGRSAAASTIRVIDFSLDRYPVVRLDAGPVSPCSSDSHFDLLQVARRKMNRFVYDYDECLKTVAKLYLFEFIRWYFEIITIYEFGIISRYYLFNLTSVTYNIS